MWLYQVLIKKNSDQNKMQYARFVLYAKEAGIKKWTYFFEPCCQETEFSEEASKSEAWFVYRSMVQFSLIPARLHNSHNGVLPMLLLNTVQLRFQAESLLLLRELKIHCNYEKQYLLY